MYIIYISLDTPEVQSPVNSDGYKSPRKVSRRQSLTRSYGFNHQSSVVTPVNNSVNNSFNFSGSGSFSDNKSSLDIGGSILYI